MRRQNLWRMVLACGGVVIAGCGGSGDTAPSAAPPSPPAERQALPALAATAEAPTPGTPATALAPVPAPPAFPSEGATAKHIEAIVAPGTQAYFQAEDNRQAPKNSVELLQRAVQVYEELSATRRDDGPDWPSMNDLNLLVKYKILRAMPTPPKGQKFLLDPKTRKVSLVPQ